MSSTAAEAMKITSNDLLQLGIIDGIIQEPLGGAHYDWDFAAMELKNTVLKTLEQMSGMTGSEIKNDRHEKFRRMGVFVE